MREGQPYCGATRLRSSGSRLVATVPDMAYSKSVIASRFLRFLTLLAVLAAPLMMLQSSPVTAASHAGMMSMAVDAAGPGQHCADMEQAPADAPGASVDCLMACAVILPGLPAGLGTQAAILSSPEPLPLAALSKDVVAEVTPPPPRGFLTI